MRVDGDLEALRGERVRELGGVEAAVDGLVFNVKGLGLRVSGFGFWVWGLWFMVWGLGFGVSGFGCRGASGGCGRELRRTDCLPLLLRFEVRIDY